MRSMFLIFLVCLIGCGTNSGKDLKEDTVIKNSSVQQTDGFPDDTYCATVEYYNPNTGTQSSYTLTVSVENNRVTELNWPNGGKLDQHHFDAADIDDDGKADFTSDKG